MLFFGILCCPWYRIAGIWWWRVFFVILTASGSVSLAVESPSSIWKKVIQHLTLIRLCSFCVWCLPAPPCLSIHLPGPFVRGNVFAAIAVLPFLPWLLSL